MSTTTYILEYDRHVFALSELDYQGLRKVYDSSLAISSSLFRFTPVDRVGDYVEIAIGSGAQFVVGPVPRLQAASLQ